MMNTIRRRRTPRRTNFAFVTLGLVAGFVLALAPAANAGRGGCSVAGSSTAKSYSGLQRAINSATDGDTLTVTGRCIGSFTIDRNLTLSGNPTTKYPNPTLDGRARGRVLLVTSASSVVITGLTISGGDAAGSDGGGIYNEGTVTLNGTSSVNGNNAYSGGGIYSEGTLTLNDASSVSGNHAGWGGGVYNNGGTVTLNNSSSVNGNRILNYGGGIYNYQGAVYLNDTSSVSGNNANDFGGIYNDGGTISPVCPNAFVTGNYPNDCVP